MDIDLLDLRQAAERTYPVHLRLGDKLLYADKEETQPCQVIVASIADDNVEQAVKTVQRIGRLFTQLEHQLAAAPNKKAREAIEKRMDDVEKEAEKSLTQFLTTAIKGWKNIASGGKPLKFSAETLSDMAQPKAPLFRLATAIAADMGEAQSPLAESASD